LYLQVYNIVSSGFGKSPPNAEYSKDPVRLLEKVLSLLELETVILVTPSMSGRYSLPFLVTHPDRLNALITVAPVDTALYADKYSQLTVCT